MAWINLSRDDFEELMEKQEDVLNGKSLELSSCLVVKTKFLGKEFIQFMRESGVYKSRLNLNMKEWAALVEQAENIRARLKNPEQFELKVKGMSNRYLLRQEERKYYFFDEEDAVSFGVNVLGQDPCLTVCTLLPNPSEEEVAAQLFAYLIEMSMKSVCEGCERNYASQRDHPCLMDWEERLERELEMEMKKVEILW